MSRQYGRYPDAPIASTERCAPSVAPCSRAWPRSPSAPQRVRRRADARLDHRDLELLPGLLVLIPASVGMRGMIFGAMGARLGTGIAAGVFEPTSSVEGCWPTTWRWR